MCAVRHFNITGLKECRILTALKFPLHGSWKEHGITETNQEKRVVGETGTKRKRKESETKAQHKKRKREESEAKEKGKRNESMTQETKERGERNESI
jgi:hypothetical protein